jgi:ABC-type transport system substrate-binding protein/DNA-binding SARP family transcriptional activator
MTDFRILGPVAVSADGRVIEIGGPRLRKLLAILLLHANEPVPRGTLVYDLWGDQPPAGAQGSLEVYISRLRKALGSPVVLTRPGAYCLQVDDGQLDAHRFEQLVAQGRGELAENKAGLAAASLRTALQLWRGPFLGELGGESFAQLEAGRLEELRLGATEDRIEADLTLGRHADVTGELEALVAVHPLRERLHGQLMLALYRGGRQAEALAAYRAAREMMVRELGLEPGPALHRLESAILRQDSDLDLHATLAWPDRGPVPPTPAPRAGGPVAGLAGPRTRRTRLAAIAAVGAGILAASLLIGFRAPAASQATLAGASGLVTVNTDSDQLVHATRLTGAPGAVSGGDGSVWVADPGGGKVSRIDPGTGAEVDRILVGGGPGSITSGAGAIWVASTVGATLTRIDPATEAVTQTIPLPGTNPGAIAYGAGGLWVADPVARELFEVDPATGSLARTLPLDLQPSALAAADGALWVAGYDNGTIERIDPASGRVTGRVRVGHGPDALAAQADSLWVANSLDATVSRVDPAALAVTVAIPVGSGPDALAAQAGSVWVANRYAGTVSRIDPGRNRAVTSLAVGGAPTSLIAGRGRLWVAVAAQGSGHRGGTLTLVTTDTLDSSAPVTSSSIDPALFDYMYSPAFGGLAYDDLVTFQRSAGADGLQIVPDLALAIPAPSDDGTTYAFRIRPGIRYSDGQPLRAGDFRRAIERLFRVGSPGQSLYAGLAGAAACAGNPQGCDLSRGIATDDAAGTVTFHLTAPDPEFPFKLTEYSYSAPIPPGTPDREPGSRTVPGTGPYRIVYASRTEVRFARNPLFREWSHAAQPAGNPDTIVWRTMPNAQVAVGAVSQGRADWFWGQIPLDQYRQLQLQQPAQLHSTPQFSIEFAPLNTHLTPFNDVRVRQALNYAIDRAKIVQLYGGPDFATPACQPIVSGLPGYSAYCPYTRYPRPDGAWSAPDMTRARQLVRESGTTGERVDVWGSPDEGFVPPGVAGYFASVLRALGYRVHLHFVPFGTITMSMRKGFQLSTDGDWTADYPDPSSYLPQFFGCGGGTSNGYFCDPVLDRAMQRASQLGLTDPARSAAAWAAIDRRLTDAAVWVPTVSDRDVELTSRRLGNYEFNPVWGFLADQSWVR